MTPAIMKIGTMPANHYFLWGNCKLAELKAGDKIRFIRQKSLVNIWERGIVTSNKNNFPVIELV